MIARRSLALPAIALLFVSASASAQKRDLLDRAVTAWTKVKTARVTFEQTIDNSLTGNTLTAILHRITGEDITGDLHLDSLGRVELLSELEAPRAHRRLWETSRSPW